MGNTPVEKIVRPFESGDVFARSRGPVISLHPITVSPDDNPVEWEGSPDTSYVEQDNIWYKNFDSDLKEDKNKRESKTVRVENPDDPDQHVFVERIDKASFTQKNGKTLNLEFDWSNPKDGGV